MEKMYLKLCLKSIVTEDVAYTDEAFNPCGVLG